MDRSILGHYLDEGCIPGGTHRNWASYGHKVAELPDRQRFLLCDPQTSGGLLVAVSPESETAFLEVALEQGFILEALGYITKREEKLVRVV